MSAENYPVAVLRQTLYELLCKERPLEEEDQNRVDELKMAIRELAEYKKVKDEYNILRVPFPVTVHPVNYGWSCPQCGRAFQRCVEECPHCQPREKEEE